MSGLSKRFGKFEVLNDVDLTFREGTEHGIVGRNGAGKTTLLRCIAGLEVHSGAIESPYTHLRSHIGLLETDPMIMSRITGYEYLQLLCNARNVVLGDFDAKNIFDLPLGKYGEHYSTGMKMKLALTAILMQENDVYILDEPFNGVDLQSNMMITELIGKLKSAQKTIIICSHIFSILRDVCDEIYTLEDGRVTDCVGKDRFEDLEKAMRDHTEGDSLAGWQPQKSK